MGDPRLWALIASWALSPPNHRAREYLACLRWDWITPSIDIELSSADKKSLLLLANICKGNKNRISVNERRIIVTGRSGSVYSIETGKGPHQAPFIIKAWIDMKSFDSGKKSTSLCIHSGPPSEIPLGDIFSSVVLTLLDDIASSERIKSLKEFVNREMDPRFRNDRYPNYRNVIYQNLDNNLDYNRGYREFLENNERELTLRLNPQPNQGDEAGIGVVNEGGAEEGQNNQPIGNLVGMQDAEENEREGDAAAVNEEVLEINPPIWADPPFRINELPADPYERARIAVENARAALRDEEIQRNIAALYELEQAGNAVRGRTGNRTPRWATLFPLFSKVMQSLPIESSMRIPSRVGGLIIFDDCGFQMNLRNEDEMEFARFLAQRIGWRLVDDNGEVVGTELWRRQAAPDDDALTLLTNHLRPLQDRLGMRAEEPWWWAYRQINGGVPEEAEVNWEMELSYADIDGQPDYFVE